MKKTKMMAFTAIFAALYFVLSATLKIPIAGHMTLDLGYIALMVAAICLGPWSALFVGAVGVFLESALISLRGVSLGWMMMNALVGYCCGWVLHRDFVDKRRFVLVALPVVLLSVFAGMTIKTLVDCLLYDLPLAAKIPVAVIGWLADSMVMLVLGLPLGISLKGRIK